jgi:hypothetical protein
MASCSLTLVDFLQCPAVYFQRLAAALQRLVSNCTIEGANYGHVMTLKLICEGLFQLNKFIEIYLIQTTVYCLYEHVFLNYSKS